MNRFAGWLTAVLLICFVFIVSVAAQAPPRDAAKEEKIAAELGKIAPKAVENFKAATAALDADNNQEAVRLYTEVLKQAPDFEAAQRRLGFAMIDTGQRTEGLALVQKALSKNRTPENLMGYAVALTNPGTNNRQATPSEYEQAFSLAKEAMQKSTDNDPDYALAAADFALSADRVDEFNAIVAQLNAKHPDLAATHFFNGIRLANEENFDAAEKELQTAESLGMSAEATARVSSGIKQYKSSRFFGFNDYLPFIFYTFGAWFLGLVVLFVAGKILSAKTLRSVENSDPNDITGGGQAGLRGFYKKLITAASIYYYLSQPVVVLLVLAVTGGVVLFFFWVGRIPIKLVAILGFVALASVFYMIKSLVTRVKTEDPGRVLTEQEAPELWRLVREVAAAVDTRAVNEIRITHGAELAVYERGGIRARMQDKAERVLIVGLAALEGFHQNAFRAVLAHEYGHFSNRDTAGGDIAFRVNADIMNAAMSMAESGTATFYNLAFQFLRFYHFLFRRITHGASRLQEILADRVAVYQYGADAFRDGLRHVIRRDIEFRYIADSEINAAYNSGRALQNLYDLLPTGADISQSLEEEYNAYLTRATTEDDTHPSPQDRFKLIERIKSKECVPLDGEVWDLFADKQALTREMNDVLEKRLRAMA